MSGFDYVRDAAVLTMPERLVINGVEYVRAEAVATAADRATDAGVKRAFVRAVSDRLATGECWSVEDVAKARGCSTKTVRKDVGGLLTVAGAHKRQRGRTIRLTARSVAKYLGYTAEAARLA